MARQIKRLGAALSIMAEAAMREEAMHEDVAAFHAPSECHADVSRGEAKRLRLARRRAEAVAGARWREIARQAKARGFGERARARLDEQLWTRLSPYGRAEIFGKGGR